MAGMRAALAAAVVAAIALSPSIGSTQTPRSPTSPPAAKANGAKTDEATERYVKEAARQDRVAIEASRLVLERSSRNGVREAAKKILDERTKAQHRLTTAASVQSLGLRPDKSAAHAGEDAVETLRNVAPEGVDRAYLRIAIENHEATLKLQDTYGRNGENDALRSHAMATAMEIEARIGDLRRLARELDGAS